MKSTRKGRTKMSVELFDGGDRETLLSAFEQVLDDYLSK